MAANVNGTRRLGARISRRRLVGAGATGAAILATLAACGKSGGNSPSAASSSPANTPKSGGKVNVRFPNDPFDWDMSFAGKSIPNDFGQSLAYDSLLTFKWGAGVDYGATTLQANLATKWETPDAITYTFQMRPGVKFANRAPVNGRAFTSADVKWSYEYWSRSGQFAGNKKLPPSQYASYFEGLDSIQTPDDATVVVKFSKPFVPFINYTGSYFNPIVPHEIYDQDGNLQTHIAGTGPWQLDESASQKGSKWVWQRNQNYWDSGKPYLDEVDWLILTDDAAAQTAFQTKQVDYLGISSDQFAAVSADQFRKANPSAQFAQYTPIGTSLYLNINVKRAPVSDVRIRQAMSLALDRDAFIKALSAGQGGWALSGAFPDTFSQAEIKQILKYDPQQAKQLVSAAGGANGVDIEFINPGSAYGQDYVSALQLMQAQFKQVGINLTLKSQDKDSWTNNRKTLNFVMTGGAKADLIADVDSWLYDFHSGNKSNYSNVSDPQLDSLIDQQRQTVDTTKRNDLVKQAVKLIATQAYSLSVWTGDNFQFWQPRVKGYAPNANLNRVPETDNWVTSG